MFSVKYAVFLFIIANWIALLEVQIEGRNAWASALPCWRANTDSWYSKVYSKIIGGGLPLTGYHALMFSLVFLFLHIPFFVNMPWKIEDELKICSAYFLLCITWDFLYFVWNPYFIVTGNYPNSISNHKTMLLGIFPGDYTVGLMVSFAFTAVACIISSSPRAIENWLNSVYVIAGFSGLTFMIQYLRGKA